LDAVKKDNTTPLTRTNSVDEKEEYIMQSLPQDPAAMIPIKKSFIFRDDNPQNIQQPTTHSIFSKEQKPNSWLGTINLFTNQQTSLCDEQNLSNGEIQKGFQSFWMHSAQNPFFSSNGSTFFSTDTDNHEIGNSEQQIQNLTHSFENTTFDIGEETVNINDNDNLSFSTRQTYTQSKDLQTPLSLFTTSFQGSLQAKPRNPFIS